MYHYNLNFYENGKLIIGCFMQVDADNARQAMKLCNARLKGRHYQEDLKEIKEQYPSFTMKAERCIGGNKR